MTQSPAALRAADEGDALEGAGSGAGHGAGLFGGVAILGDDAGDAEGGGVAEYGADVAGVGDLIEDQDWARPVEHGGERGGRQEVGEEGDALMDGVAAEHVVELGAIGAFGGERPGLGDAGGEFLFGVLGDEEALEAAGRVGQRGLDGVHAV
jgi:hypothetical protein